MFRIHHEMRTQMHPGYFLTLTYSDKYVKRVPDQGLSLRFRDVQLFLKQIRKWKYYAKYICVGEYGSTTKRPHYHLLLWTDTPPVVLERLWFRGTVQFGTLTMASAMYTLKYIIQPKQRETKELEKTRAQFSKGLGLAYLTRATYHYHTADYDNPVLFSIIDGRKVALPRYYKNKIFTPYQMKEEQIKNHLRIGKEKRALHKELYAQGITRPKPYLLALRVEQARRILSTTKFNQKV